ncbi:Alpha/Beta hydrolase protein [Xylariaceae sp. FL0804]|nr:Alpha/Beta hydrolase protein [Xylariaceae sp. FL0804]
MIRPRPSRLTSHFVQEIIALCSSTYRRGGDSPTVRGESSRSGLSFLERRLKRLSLARPDTKDGDDLKGPLGLNLLYSPSETIVDIVFVHGLGGGSRKTWSSSNDACQFWPKEWLPAEPGFKNVRIHSFGYNSNWRERKESVLNVLDFAQALLFDLQTSPDLRRNSDTPLLLVGHSMGGLVMKQAYLLATRNPDYEDISRRIHSMFFLGTPHHGAGSARMLANVLSASFMGQRTYVNDLTPNSGRLQVCSGSSLRFLDHFLTLTDYQRRVSPFVQ